MIQVIVQYSFNHSKAIDGNASGLVSQLTHCKLNGIEFYVRENINGTPTFLISSGERWGDKAGKKPSKHRQVLELYAEDQWNEIAEAVRKADGLKRPVLQNKLFNKQWVDKLINQQLKQAV